MTTSHDIAEIEMAEEVVVEAEKLKKVKRSKRTKGMAEAEGLQEDFEMDVQDPRFAAVFDRHDFAIDPTNPRFVKTEGTKKLMEERRKRSATGNARGDGAPDEDGRDRKRTKTDGAKAGKTDELASLVQSLKKKAKLAKAAKA